MELKEPPLALRAISPKGEISSFKNHASPWGDALSLSKWSCRLGRLKGFLGLLMLLSLFTSVSAASISGRIVDRSSGKPLSGFTLKVNGQSLQTSELGWYNLENLNEDLKEIYLPAQDNDNPVLLITRKSILHWQLGKIEMPQPEESQHFDLRLELTDRGLPLTDADITVFAVDAQNQQTFYLRQKMEDYYQGVMRIKDIGYRGKVYLLIEKSNQKWIKSLNPVSGGELKIGLDFSTIRFQASPAQALADDSFSPPQMLSAFNFSKSDAIFYEGLIPVFRRDLNQGMAWGLNSDFPPDDFQIQNLISQASKFSGKLSSFFHFWELELESIDPAQPKGITVYSDEPELNVDLSAYGRFKLKSLRLYPLVLENKMDLDALKQSRWIFVYTPKP